MSCLMGLDSSLVATSILGLRAGTYGQVTGMREEPGKTAAMEVRREGEQEMGAGRRHMHAEMRSTW